MPKSLDRKLYFKDEIAWEAWWDVAAEVADSINFHLVDPAFPVSPATETGEL